MEDGDVEFVYSFIHRGFVQIFQLASCRRMTAWNKNGILPLFDL